MLRKPHIEIISSLARTLRVHEAEPVQNGGESIGDQQLAAQQEILSFQRRILIDFHKEGTYDQSMLRRIEQELDHAVLLTGKAHQEKNLI